MTSIRVHEMHMVECIPINVSVTILFVYDSLSSLGFRNLPTKFWLLGNKYTFAQCIWIVIDTIEHKYLTVNTCTRTWCEWLDMVM